MSRPALRRCVAGDLEVFAQTVWSRRPLLSPRAALHACGGGDGFGDLFSLDAADELLCRRGLRTPFLRIAKGGDVVPPSRYTRSGGTGALIADQVADDRVLALFADGYTLVLQGLHRTWAPLGAFAGQLASDLGHPVQVNSYLTPRQSQGFSAHYDVHDVFVLQVAGEKRWFVHEPVLRDPLRDEPWTERREEVARRAKEEPVLETVLRAGDALYLPRGFLHSAEALGDVSCHLTVGVHPVTRQAVLDEVVALVRDDPSLRGSLPLGTDVADPSAVEREVSETLAALVARLTSVTADAVAPRLARRQLGANRPAALAPLSALRDLEALTGGTEVTGRRHQRVQIETSDGASRLRLADRTVPIPPGAEAAVRQLLDGAVFAAGKLPGLAEADSRVLVRQLLAEGILVVRSDQA